MKKIYVFENSSGFIKNQAALLEQNGFTFVSDKALADVLIFSHPKSLQQCHPTEHQKVLWWTNEPRWSTSSVSSTEFNGHTISVMNCYTGDIYVDIFRYFWVTKNKQLDYITEKEINQRRKISLKPAYFMASNHGSGKPLIIDGHNVDLYAIRDKFALSGHEQGLVDIYGQGWPEGIAVLESRMDKPWLDWETRKLEIANNYMYSVCLENTKMKNYVTEKFWHSIMSKTIPIYFLERTGVDEYFDRSCFIDLSSVSFQEAFEVILSLPTKEYMDTVNTLIRGFNSIITKRPDKHGSIIMANKLLERIKLLTEK